MMAAPVLLCGRASKVVGFLGSLAYCSGDCRTFFTWLIDLELTWLTGFPFKDLIDETDDIVGRRLSQSAPVESGERQQLAVRGVGLRGGPTRGSGPRAARRRRAAA